MKLYAVTYDDRRIPFDDRYLSLVEKHMAARTVFKLSGLPVSGADIRRIERPGEGESGPHLHSMEDIAARLEGAARGLGESIFWRDSLRLNFARKAERRPWLLNAVLRTGRRESGLDSAADVFAFLDAEWETFGPQNRDRTGTVHAEGGRGGDLGSVELKSAYVAAVRAQEKVDTTAAARVA